MVSIARKNLFQDLPRFIVAQAGIMFAVGLVTIQMGLLNGFTRSSSLLTDSSTADIWVASQELRYLDLTLPIPYERLEQARNVNGVEQAEALITQGSVWRYGISQIAPIRIVGFDPEGELFQPEPLIEGSWAELNNPYAIAIDRLDLTTLDVTGLGDTSEIGSFRTDVVAITSGIRSIVSSPFVFTSLNNATAFLNSPVAAPVSDPPVPPELQPESLITFVLVKARPDENLQQLKRRLEVALPDVMALTQDELADLTQDYWRQSTGVGFILGLGAVVGIIVGTVVVGQILYSSVSDHLREFGTLKAMGSSDWFIYRIILEQALWMAVLGYLPGMALCLGVGAWTLEAQAVQILIGPTTAVGVFVVTVAMCSGAAVFAIQKVTRLDPAVVFKSS
ncbi:FtsX-like permease family protein [Synechococcales cyanobacterium C]|uniref:FtsX-like permease family protein n=1 Tax=Petrachloros mirabilis ULC683 TaxID=2781853 RepID=A0A8K2A1B6_9CYAN|nr:FtsX-like permease family protein [Petrachloros mirabilis]NCJ07993.1 FtsX-like permease family protein [Petrachloros mirabilis ULC683]